MSPRLPAALAALEARLLHAPLRRRLGRGLLGLLLLAGLLIVAAAAWEARPLAWLDPRAPQGAAQAAAAPGQPADPAARGAYLARAGHCAGCHTAPGGPPLAGGRPVDTPWGSVVSANLTPRALGAWTVADLDRALRHGRRPAGGFVHPTCPTEFFAHLAPQDVAALHAHLQGLPPAETPAARGSLPPLLASAPVLAVWRAFFRPGVPAALPPPPPPRPGEPPWDTSRQADWARGAYLARGLGHCQACHAARNPLGGLGDPAAGGWMPDRDWLAPSLLDNAQAGVGDWPLPEIVALLRDGHAPRGLAQGPMARVVLGSTQHLSPEDLAALALHLQRLAPAEPAAPAPPPAPAPPRQPRPQPAADPAATGRAAPRLTPAEQARLAPGAQLYAQHCAACHGADGEGVDGPGGVPVYPPLAGHRLLAQDPPVNLLRIVLEGGFGPATAGHPQPHGMPPFDAVLDDGELRLLLNHLRSRWGRPGAAPLSDFDLQQARQRRP